MDLGLDGCAAVVTGAASGIGLACAGMLAAEGMRVGLLDRDRAGLERAAAALADQGGPEAPWAVAEVADGAAMAKAISVLGSRLAGIDALVCCAGTSGPFGVPIDQVSAREFSRVLEVNVTGAFVAVKHALPRLRAAAYPAIVLMASDSSFVAAGGMVPYCASKGAVLQLARALSVELADDGIRVNCVCPSIVDTPMSRGDLGDAAFVDPGYPVQAPDDVARHVAYLCSPASGPVNGTSLVSDFGYLARSSFPA